MSGYSFWLRQLTLVHMPHKAEAILDDPDNFTPGRSRFFGLMYHWAAFKEIKGNHPRPYIQQKPTYVVYLHKVQQASEAPGNRVEPLWSRIRPLRVNQLSQVAIWEVAVSEAWWVILHGDVASGEMSEAQKVAGSLDVTLLLRWEDGQPWSSQALLATLPAWRGKFRFSSVQRDTFSSFWCHICLRYHINGLSWPRRTDIIFHNLGVVSIKDRSCEPSHVELDVSLCCFDVPLVGDVHRFPPVSR